MQLLSIKKGALEPKAPCTLVLKTHVANTVNITEAQATIFKVSQKSSCTGVSLVPAWGLSRPAGKLWSARATAPLSGRSAPAARMRVVASSPQPLLQHSEQLLTTEGDYSADSMHPEIPP